MATHPLPTPPPATQARLVHMEDDFLTYLEEDLQSKVRLAYQSKSISARVAGVFSLEDMESKAAEELCNQIGVGIGYLGAETVAQAAPNSPPDRSRVVQMLDFRYLIILAVPIDNGDAERYDALTLLTVLRKGIAGKTIAGDQTSRTWMFVSEAPRIVESTPTVLYYAQVWRAVMPNVAT